MGTWVHLACLACAYTCEAAVAKSQTATSNPFSFCVAHNVDVYPQPLPQRRVHHDSLRGRLKLEICLNLPNAQDHHEHPKPDGHGSSCLRLDGEIIFDPSIYVKSREDAPYARGGPISHSSRPAFLVPPPHPWPHRRRLCPWRSSILTSGHGHPAWK